MNTNTDFDRIAQTWLQEGPTAIPDRAIRAALDEVHTTRQRRFGAAWRIFHVNTNTLRLTTAAVVSVLIVAAAVFYLGNLGPSGGVGGTPSVSPTPTATAALPELTETFTSPFYGYSVGYSADSTVEPATVDWFPLLDQGNEVFDFIKNPVFGVFRAASDVAPEGVAIDDWIDEFITGDDAGTCNPRRITLPEVTIDGQTGRISAGCPEEVEATVVVGQRVYLFTLFNDASNRRAVFDAIVATIDLRPEDALPTPSPTPSPS